MPLTTSDADTLPVLPLPAPPATASAIAAPNSIQPAMDQWKDALLNSVRANPLLHLPESGTVEVGPAHALPDVCNLLLLRAKPVFLWNARDTSFRRTVLQQPGNFPASPAVLETLRYLHTQAESLLQSQDVNVLFLAFGVLAWRDEQSGEAFRSPLLLVPVTLERNTAEGEGFELSRVEQAVEINPLLQIHLAQEKTGFVLPPLPEEAYLVVSSYLAQVAALAEGRDGWEVESKCLLGRFPLLKMRLYEDIAEHEEHVQSHPFLRALAGDTDALEELAVPPPDVDTVAGENLPTPSLPSPFQLLDADPDQERAIQAAMQGKSFVLQGPPGTGKTQTITNIIGECIASGKSVLLVSGRVSSLEAVHQRLTEKGLGDLCLTAHSRKTNKRDILQQLSQSLKPMAAASPAEGAAAVKLSPGERREREMLSEELETVVRELHRVRQPLGLSLYDAYGVIAQTENRDPLRKGWAQRVAEKMSDAENVSASEYRQREDLAGRLAVHPLWSQIPDTALWDGAFERPLTVQGQTALPHAFANAIAVLYRVRHAAASLSQQCRLEPPQEPQEVENLLQLIPSLLAASPHCLWLLDGSSSSDDPAAAASRLPRYQEQAGALIARAAALRSAQDGLLERYSAAILRLPPGKAADLIERLTKRQEAILSPLLGEGWQDASIAAMKDGQLCEKLEALQTSCECLDKEVNFLIEACGVSIRKFTSVLTLSDDLQTLLRVVQEAASLPAFCAEWLVSAEDVSRRQRLCAEAEERWQQLEAQKTELFLVYDEDVLTLNHADLLENLAASPAGLNRLVNTPALRSRRALQAVRKPGFSGKEREVGADLTLAQQLRANQLWCHENARVLEDAFGTYYQEGETDWDYLRGLLEVAEGLCAAVSSPGGILTPNDSGGLPFSLLSLVGAPDSGEMNALKERGELVADLLAHTTGILERLIGPAGVMPSPQSSFARMAQWCGTHCQAMRDQREAIRTAVNLLLPGAAAEAAHREGAYPAVAMLTAALETAEFLQAEETAFNAEAATLAPALCGPFFRREATNWVAVSEAIQQAQALHELFIRNGQMLPPSLPRLLAEDEDRTLRSALLVEQLIVKQEWEKLTSALTALTAFFRPAYTLINDRPLENASFSELNAWLEARQEGAEQISRMQPLLDLRRQYSAQGLTSFFDGLSSRPGEALPAAAGVPVFRAAFHRAWAEAIVARIPVLAEFNGAAHSRKIERFCTLDRRFLESAPGRIRQAVKGNKIKQTLRTEVNLLTGQLARRRTGEVRTLLAQIPGLLLALKPCVMMNPLSVRLFLDPSAIAFDVVLFDDASQIATEEAVGAISRGRQVIIAGDSQQIPPLPLMTEVQGVRESILDTANTLVAHGLPSLQGHALNWHYRSQNPGLIAYSRRHFYPGLVAFPSASCRSAVEQMVLPGTDPSDSRAIIDAVIAYRHREPTHSVGVVVLDDTAQISLQDEIARRETEGSDADPAAARLSETGSEAFCLQTIENVQGDEWDMLLLFLPADPARWGALNQTGGNRLLNVAATRARCHMIVATALTPTIFTAATDPETASPAGVILRQFLEVVQETIAENSASSGLPPSEEMQSGGGACEELVGHVLKEKGYPFHSRVGMPDCQIDFAVSDAAQWPHRYLLGILGDGPAYARGGTARQRDRQLPALLQERGWNLHRVWSLDCYQEPEQQMQSIEEAYRNAAAAAGPRIALGE